MHLREIVSSLKSLQSDCPDTNLHGNSAPGFPFLVLTSLRYEWGDPSFDLFFVSQISSSLVHSSYELGSSNKIEIRRNAEKIICIYEWPEIFLNLVRKKVSARSTRQVLRAFEPLLTQNNCRACFSLITPFFWKKDEKRERLESFAFQWIVISTESRVRFGKKKKTGELSVNISNAGVTVSVTTGCFFCFCSNIFYSDMVPPCQLRAELSTFHGITTSVLFYTYVGKLIF